MQFSTLATLAFGFVMTATALPQNPTVLEVRQTACTPGQQYCQVCPPHTDGFPPNCIGVCGTDGLTMTITQQCPTVCATECEFPSCPLVCA